MSRRAGEVLWMFDLGNTSLKGRWSRSGSSGQAIALDWDAPDLGRRLRMGLEAWPAPDRTLVASVASARRAGNLRRVLRRWPRAQAEWLASPRRACGITNAYRIPERLGIDRFLAMAGARAVTRGAPFVVVGCGTALTLDAVDASGRQREGLIVPSPDLMMRALRGGTAIGESNLVAFGNASDSEVDDTRSAIRAGCWRAATALIASFHARIRDESGEVALLLHGGGSPELKMALDACGVVDARPCGDAVWRGLLVWATSRARRRP